MKLQAVYIALQLLLAASAQIREEDSAPQAGDDPVPLSDGGTAQHSGGGSDPHQNSPTSGAPVPDPVNDVSEPKKYLTSTTQMSDQ